jgi:hypothetical protein
MLNIHYRVARTSRLKVTSSGITLMELAYAGSDPDQGWEDDAVEQFDVTVRGTWVTLTESHRLGARRFLFASSLNVYGDLGDGPYPESFDVLHSPRLDPADPYGMCKYLAEQLMARFCATRGATGLAFRMDSVHAPVVMERRGVHVDDVAEAFARALMLPLQSSTSSIWLPTQRVIKRQTTSFSNCCVMLTDIRCGVLMAPGLAISLPGRPGVLNSPTPAATRLRCR